MPKIIVDGSEYEVEEGANLLEACLSAGLDLPYFCWHPAMGSVGACRQCAVVQYQDENDERGRIVMGCMTPVADGAIFSLGGDRASGFRKAIVESLMLNHPHDCAVCAEGGECHLQDMTVMTGHRDRRYRGQKNTYRNQYLGPLINHEMNRCITCYRCTRYYRDYAGGTDLAALASHDHVYFGRHAEGTLESEFAGNLVEVCPTGVFTDKTLLGSYTRKWDLQSAPSVCAGCAVGCNTLPGERYGKLKRVHNRFNAEVNGYFLCDRGRYGSGYVNSESRLDYPGLRDGDGRFNALDEPAALSQFASLLKGKRLAGIGSPRASLEANFLLRELVGDDHFSPGVSNIEQGLLTRAAEALRSSTARIPSLAEVERADAVLVLGDDVTHTAPRLALALRQSVRNKAYELAADLKLHSWQDAAIRNLAQEQRSPLISITPGSTRLDDVAETTLHCSPREIAAEAYAIADAVHSAASTDAKQHDGDAARIATILKGAKRPLIVAGTSLCEPAVVDAAARIATALAAQNRDAMLSLILPEANSLGQALLADDDAPDLSSLTALAEAGAIDTLLVLENDLYRRGTAQEIDRLFNAVSDVVILDCIESPGCSAATLVLPTASVIESEGTFVSMEGRAQRYFAVFPPAQGRRAALQWLLLGAKSAENDQFAELQRVDDVVAACAAAVPALAKIKEAAPGQDYRSHGMRIPRQPHRYSGRTAMRANISVHEPRQTQDDESPLAYSMEGLNRDEPGSLLPYVWAPGWNSNQSLHKFQGEVGGAIRGGTGGVRLLDDHDHEVQSVAAATGASSSAAAENDFELIPCPRIFGSDELSALSDGVSELVPRAYLEFSPADAARLDIRAGDGVVVNGGEAAFEVRIDEQLRDSCIAYAPGIPGCETLIPRSAVKIAKAVGWEPKVETLIASDGVAS